MNALFLVLFVCCALALAVADPAAFLPALIAGAKDAVTLCLSLAAVYAVWLGFLKVAEDAGVLRGMAKCMKPLTARLFRTRNERALGPIAVTLSAIFLGMGGAATPAGISAMRLLGQGERAEYARAMLFVVNCAGLQLFPVTAVALRAELGSASPYDIVLPAVLASLSSLLLGMVLVRIAFAVRAKVRG